MQRIDYPLSDREVVRTQLELQGMRIIEDTLIDLNAENIPQTCYYIVETATPTESDLLCAADERILELEYENLTLKEGLA